MLFSPRGAAIRGRFRASLGIACTAELCSAPGNEIDEQISGTRKSNLGVLPISRLEFKRALYAPVRVRCIDW